MYFVPTTIPQTISDPYPLNASSPLHIFPPCPLISQYIPISSLHRRSRKQPLLHGSTVHNCGKQSSKVHPTQPLTHDLGSQDLSGNYGGPSRAISETPYSGKLRGGRSLPSLQPAPLGSTPELRKDYLCHSSPGTTVRCNQVTVES